MRAAEADQDAPFRRQFLEMRRQLRHALRLDEDGPRVAIADDVHHLARRIAPVEPRPDRAGLQAGKPVFGHLDPVVRQDGGAHALPHAHFLHDPRQLIGATVHLGPVAAAVGIDIGNVAWKFIGTAPHEIAKEHYFPLNSRRSR